MTEKHKPESKTEDENPILGNDGKLSEKGIQTVRNIFVEISQGRKIDPRDIIEFCKKQEEEVLDDEKDPEARERRLKVIRGVRALAVFDGHSKYAQKKAGVSLPDQPSPSIEEQETANRVLESEAAALEEDNNGIVETDLQVILEKETAEEKTRITTKLRRNLARYPHRTLERGIEDKIVAGALSVAALYALFGGYASSISKEKDPTLLQRELLRTPVVEPTPTAITDYSFAEVFPNDYLTTGEIPIPDFSLEEEAILKKNSPDFVAQTFNGQCGPAVISMLESFYDNGNATKRMWEITREFYEKGYIDPENGDNITSTTQMVEYLKEKGFSASYSYDFLTPKQIVEHFETNTAPVIINVTTGYLQGEPDHWALLLGVTEQNGVRYIHLMDPLVSSSEFGTQIEADARMVALEDGSILLKETMWQGATNGVGIQIEENN